jgi:hypothetical protein
VVAVLCEVMVDSAAFFGRGMMSMVRLWPGCGDGGDHVVLWRCVQGVRRAVGSGEGAIGLRCALSGLSFWCCGDFEDCWWLWRG